METFLSLVTLSILIHAFILIRKARKKVEGDNNFTEAVLKNLSSPFYVLPADNKFVVPIHIREKVVHMKTDLNKLAKKVTLKEGLKKQVSIGQVKEVMKITFQELAKMNVVDVADIIKRYK